MPQKGNVLSQQFIRIGELTVAITEVKPESGDYFVLPKNAEDARQLTDPRDQAEAFYFSGGTLDAVINFDDASNKVIVIASRHRGSLNQ